MARTPGHQENNNFAAVSKEFEIDKIILEIDRNTVYCLFLPPKCDLL